MSKKDEGLQITHANGVDILRHFADAGVPGTCAEVEAVEGGFYVAVRVGKVLQKAFITCNNGMEFRTLLDKITEIAVSASRLS